MPPIACILLPYFYDAASRKSAAYQPGVPANSWEQVRESLLRICLNYTTSIEPVTSGLAFLDLSGLPSSAELVPELAQIIAKQIGFPVALGWSRYRQPAHLAARLAAQPAVSFSTRATELRPGPIRPSTPQPASPLGRSQAQARWQIVPPGEEETFVAPLPLRWAEDLPIEVSERLQKLGLRTWGQLATLPPADLIAQVGEEQAIPLMQWAHGRDERPVRALYPPPYVEARWPTGTESSRVEPLLPAQLPTIINEWLQPTFLAALQEGPWQAQRLLLTLRTSDCGLAKASVSHQVAYAPPQGVQPEAKRVYWQLQTLLQKLLPTLRRPDRPTQHPSTLSGFTAIEEVRLRGEGLTPAPVTQEPLLAGSIQPEGGVSGKLLDLLAVWQQRFGAHIQLGAQQPLSRREQVHALWRQLHQM